MPLNQPEFSGVSIVANTELLNTSENPTIAEASISPNITSQIPSGAPGGEYQSNAMPKTNNTDVIKRIGEQKTTVYNLIKLLTPYYSQPEITDLIDSLMDLNEIYEKIETTKTKIVRLVFSFYRLA